MRSNMWSTVVMADATRSIYIDLAETSRRLSLSPRTIRAWVHDPERALPAYRVNGKLIFRWSEVVRWLEQFRIEPVDVKAVADEFLSNMKER